MLILTIKTHFIDSTGNHSVADPETNLASDSTPIWLPHIGDIELSDQNQNFNIFKMLDGDSKIAHFRRFTQDSNSRLDIFDISGYRARRRPRSLHSLRMVTNLRTISTVAIAPTA